jgi:hypothetical protein
MTVSLFSYDFNNRIKNKTPVCKNIQGFVLCVTSLRKQGRSLHHAAHTATATIHRSAVKLFFSVISQYALCC